MESSKSIEIFFLVFTKINFGKSLIENTETKRNLSLDNISIIPNGLKKIGEAEIIKLSN